MLANCNVVALVLASDEARAKEFYGETLGLTFVERDSYALVFDANGIRMRVTIMPGHKPSEHPVLGWDSPDIVATVTGLVKAGVVIERYSYLEQDELGIWTAPDGIKKVVFFKDPDGNLLSLAQKV
jgi:catechol 2,3-dioxygenase-like lactoylglutathione lyase family enzyme